MLHSTLFEHVKASVVFDPEELVAKNLNGDLIFISTDEELQLVAKTAADVLLFVMSNRADKQLVQQFAAVVSLPKLKLKSMEETGLYYFQGHYNTIRFAFPSTLKSPLYYNVKGEKFEYPIYKQYTDKLLMALGMHSLVSNRKFFIYHANNPHFSAETPFFIYSEQYVFNKKALLFEVEGNEIKSLTKHSDSEYAREMIENEARVLQGIESLLNGEVACLPKVLNYNQSLNLSNNYPNGAEMTDQVEDLHIQALQELYEAQLGVAQVGNILNDNSYINTIKAFKLILAENLQPNGLSRKHLEDISIDLILLMNRMNAKEPVYTSIYHGNFIAENCLKKDNKLYINNFEQTSTDKPLLFDLFHYVFHQVEQKPIPLMGELDDTMKFLFKNKSLMTLIEKRGINFKLNLALFHIHHIITQIERFLKQRYINPNVNFTLQFYKQALERMNSISF